MLKILSRAELRREDVMKKKTREDIVLQNSINNYN